jgi:hypothetical protein
VDVEEKKEEKLTLDSFPWSSEEDSSFLALISSQRAAIWIAAEVPWFAAYLLFIFFDRQEPLSFSPI